MKSILLIGLGRFGMNMALQLSEMQKYEVMAVDRDEERVNAVMGMVTDAQIGDATKEEFLRTLGVNNFDLCFVAIPSDFQSSLETTSLLKDLGARKVVSLASREVHRKFLLRNGADEVVYPEKQMATWAVIRHAVDYVLDFIPLDAEYSIYEVTTPEEWDGRSVGTLDIRKKYGLNILVVRNENGPVATVTSETVLRSGQTMLVLGKWKDLQKCFRI